MEDYLPSIYGNKIAWTTHGPCDCYWLDVYDISTKKFFETGMYARGSPSIYGNKLVCYDSFDMVRGIYLYDLSTFKGTMIVSNESEQGSPAIYGNRIVWEDYRNENWDIYMYDLSTKKETQITTNKSEQRAPVIYGISIVWQDNRNGNWDIYAYDLVTGQQIHTTDKSDQVDPAIYSNKVVWTDSRNGNPDIYMGTISYLPVAAFTASPTYGKAPLTVKFTEKSTDAYYWSWNFGDKTTSTDQNPVHKYSAAGKYTVTLTAKNAAGSNTMKKTDYITVN
jgi:beta propeller repeat protein